ncbi:nitrophenyl compound nitroreductase subunit ArsF family protein [Xiashengella succiniciproducens]|uniref:Nitrophenyl compound nitroreductase subunit ArsF family protein n=1 Tax=Xiashengella succiniciproducens TaxID=2949635 RepID=A0A9J6ZT03_9BACT|nr:nitrophenyl compound nitroreductase subunit ArsF family protein [Alkaliflexus sp. Ai-910]URW80718.1 nitrophenyl compound nitroreductase subunit ArsF family protein [Alkaliflexus sp. Ai-910]
MKNVILIMLSLFFVTACGNGGQKKAQNTDAATETKTAVADANTVYVYYFHGKQRCMTCNTVEKVAKQAIEANYASNTNVKFLVLPTDDKANEALVEKYEISWNGLIIDKGGNVINITEQAFANAVNSPDVLADLIKSEVNKRLN